MGKIVMPKNSALLNEIESVLKIYYEADGWISNDIYKQQLKSMIGDDQYSSSYTKKAQITSYFGFTIWEDINRPTSMRKITESGKHMYQAIRQKDIGTIQRILLEALETVTFGRHNYGCPESNSDVEPPKLFIRASLDLEYLTYREFAYLLWKLEDIGQNYTDAISDIRRFRPSGTVQLGEEATKYTDCKPIMILVRWGFLEEDGDDSTGGKHIKVAKAVIEKYEKRLRNLKVYNIDMNSEEYAERNPEEMTSTDSNNCLNVSRVPRDRKKEIHPLNCIIYGAPGTGKTYATAEYALAIIKRRAIDKEAKTLVQRKELMKEYNDFVRKGQIVFTTFHQSYGYEDFIQGLRPDTKSENMSFITADGTFKKIADVALSDLANNYVIIIDEINRGNISKVFGELITLIEEDKRWGEVNGTCATLQSGDVFAVPNNLYIVGTMNSADKSISLIDAALRRRFEFIEQRPNEDLIQNEALKKVFSKLNDLLAESLESSDLLVGHSYFMNKEEADLCTILNNSIIPLLYEYFYDNKKKVIGILTEALKDQQEVRIIDPIIGRVYTEQEATQTAQ